VILTFFLISLPFLPTDPVTRIDVRADNKEKVKSGSYPYSGGRVKVIIRTSSNPSAMLKSTVGKMGGKLKKEFKFFKGIACELPQSVLEELAKSSEVISIQPDSKTYPLMDVTTDATGADVAWQNYGLDGSGIGVAVIDSGISNS